MGKQILDKVTANQKVVETRRRKAKFESDGTPLLAFYTSWKKTRDLQQMKRVSQQEKMDDYSYIPDLKKNNKKIRMKQQVLGDGDEIFGDDDSGDDSFDDEEQFKLKEERGKKRKKSVSDDEEDDSDDEMENDSDGEKVDESAAPAAKAPDDSDNDGDSD